MIRLSNPILNKSKNKKVASQEQSEIIEQLLNLGIFRYFDDGSRIHYFDLIDTQFRLVLTKHDLYWVEYQVVTKKDYVNTAGMLISENCRDISFEDVLNYSDSKIQLKLLFCLDLFR